MTACVVPCHQSTGQGSAIAALPFPGEHQSHNAACSKISTCSRIWPGGNLRAHRRPSSTGVVNGSLASPRGQGSKFWQTLQLGLCGVGNIQSPPTARISEVFSSSGGGKGVGGGFGRGGGDGGDNFGVPNAGGASSIGANSGSEKSASPPEDFIILNIGGMSCGGCASSVKRILESQPQVTEATVTLATETAVVKITPDSVAKSGWEKMKDQLAKELAKHLTTCGFKSSVRDTATLTDNSAIDGGTVEWPQKILTHTL